MNSDDKNIITSLQTALQDARDQGEITISEYQVATPFLKALATGSFEFAIEYWHGPDDELPGEMLLRAYMDSEQSERIGNAEPLRLIYNNGMGPLIDLFLARQAFSQAIAQDVFPVSLNISPQSAVSQNFWDMLLPSLGTHNPRDLVFEILEPDVPEEGDLGVIEKMRAQGYRFALDDTHHGHHESRLEYFKEHVDFVKIDGRAIRAEFDKQSSSLRELVEKIQEKSPRAMLVAEWVENAHEQKHLHEMGVANSQGRELPDERQNNDQPSVRGNIKPPHG